ncbi:MAG: isopenicillin-N N-acyltransferase like protein [Gaiellales bacterium]|jgi:isopenicillin-N N-acyltransferase-like protein|nr:isopenicillin-N N-acyltransferase like protein [Gaiellales bacterium]
MQSIPSVRVEGGSRERGRQYGEIARERVQRSIEAYHAVFAHYAGWDWPTVSEHALRYVAPIEDAWPRYMEEIRGIAEGARAELADVMAINTRTEIMFAAKAAHAGGDLPPECSAFAALPEATADGGTLMGQNWDWLLHSMDTCVVLEASQDGAPDFVTVVEAGLLAKAGMNSSGLGLCTNALVCGADRGEPGIPYHVVLRAILDAETMSDALTSMQRGVRSSSATYLIGHTDGLAVTIEGVPGNHTQLHLRFGEDGVLLHTNHFLADIGAARDISPWAFPDSPFRLDRMRRIVGDTTAVSVGLAQRLLADHANYPNAICCHPDTRSEAAEQWATVASLIMELDARVLHLASGQPCSAPYARLDYSDFLSKQSPVAPVG